MTNAFPSHIFRGYDLRGIVGKELTDEFVSDLAKGYATWLLQRRIFDCVFGYDCRLSSEHFRDIMVKELTDSGITVYDIGLTLTQIVYFAGYYFRTRGAIMITASHNPKEYNGMKLGVGFSETMITEEILQYRDLVQSKKFVTRSPKGQHIQKDIFQDYVIDLLRHIEPIKKKFKIVVDSCAGTTGIFIPELLRKVGCEVIEQNTKPDGNFPVGTPDPTERDVQERLAKRVKEEHADIGFSYDADGDRLGVVDNNGGLLWNDVLVSIFAKDVLEYLPGSKIIYNTLCSKQADEVIRTAGGIPIIWKTGHSFIKAKVREERAAFGGELSGHFFFVDNFYGHDDGAIASLRILSYLDRHNTTLSDVIASLPQYVSSPEIKVGCPDAVKFDIVSKRIDAEMKKIYPDATYITIDGVRMDTKEEMMIVRASQNGPYLTVKFEGKTQEAYDKLKQQVSIILHGIPEIDFKSGTNTTALD
ncbi:MAG: phosphomannomutase/phosphoglucomutase [Candidatus Gottesmanbacteria bacterium]